MSSIVPVPEKYLTFGKLKVHPSIGKVVEESICPGACLTPTAVWTCLESLIVELGPEVEQCLARRDELQQKIDERYTELGPTGVDEAYLKEIGYLEESGGPVAFLSTDFVDPEIASVAAPQLVVPSDNARYVLNAVNSRWGSLFDALYGFDVLPTTGDVAASATSGYNPLRGKAVIDYANGLLDRIVPLATGKWSEVKRLVPVYIGETQQLALYLQSGGSTTLDEPNQFVGSTGSLGEPTEATEDKGRVFLKQNGLHLILELDRKDRVGKDSLSGIKDITLEAALTTILDMEDSVSAVDAEDKARVYSNISGIYRGTLTSSFMKDGKTMERAARPDFSYRSASGQLETLPGRAIALVRNVGHHMFTDMVLFEGRTVPEGFVDLVVTAAAALPDLRGMSKNSNTRQGSVYIVKPKMHGPREVALADKMLSRVEGYFGLRRGTLKMGMMDEERRTSANLAECIRAARSRLFFINTGFLDRTGDEIHTCMLAGPVVRKADMKKESWIAAYEARNVDFGLHSGFVGRAQIGKGMWAKPDSMKAMLDVKQNELLAGASTAWVPSPSGAVLHSLHYHFVKVSQVQHQLMVRAATSMTPLLEPPLLKASLTKEQITEELRESAQSILGYVVRWVDLGVGCSKVPDLRNVGLMEDRATLRISSQLLANWLKHKLISEADLRSAFEEMAKVVDGQNSKDKSYKPMAGNFNSNIAFKAALKLVTDGQRVPNGYTECTLHEARRQVKATSGSA
mmetsp:Transcript_95259/g.199233  ORF Transcript_95259/g.199233 Transcript_95259/m.199233 type:complete len:742 (+) Transcript_95259:92-2317(+)